MKMKADPNREITLSDDLSKYYTALDHAPDREGTYVPLDPDDLQPAVEETEAKVVERAQAEFAEKIDYFC